MSASEPGEGGRIALGPVVVPSSVAAACAIGGIVWRVEGETSRFTYVVQSGRDRRVVDEEDTKVASG